MRELTRVLVALFGGVVGTAVHAACVDNVVPVHGSAGKHADFDNA